MKEQFVTYEIALALKELGFDNNDFGHYDKNGKLCIYSEYLVYDTVISERDTDAPLWQQAIDWLRENHKLNVIIDNKYEHQIDKWVGITQNTNIYYDEYVTNKFDSYYEAREQAVLKAIELIKTV